MLGEATKSSNIASRRSLVLHRTDLSKRSTLDKWKINVIAAIKRKLDKKAGIAKPKETAMEESKQGVSKEDTHNPDFSPF